MNDIFLINLTLSENSQKALKDLPKNFIESLVNEELHLVASAFVALNVVKRGMMALKTFQLEVMLSVLQEKFVFCDPQWVRGGCWP